jgi:Type II CAAX prenyl endopeptidase Rce1-like
MNCSGGYMGVKWGIVTGLLLGAFNALVILWVVPRVGGDILFLKETPHALMPLWVMVPWGILVIAIGVEINFRGFLLGRLRVLFFQWFRDSPFQALAAEKNLAVMSSALVFAFDPFMVMTFEHLHWIAVWDGLVWGWMFIHKRNLMMVIMAHAVEVVILYSCIKLALA